MQDRRSGIAAVGANAEQQVDVSRERLLSAERYAPPLLRVKLSQALGRVRPSAFPRWANRVVQQTTRQVVQPRIEAKFCQ